MFMNSNSFSLSFTKFLDVKSPLGIEQKNDFDPNSQFYSIGVDVYMPKPNQNFVTELLKCNRYLKLNNFDNKTKNFDLVNRDGTIVFRYHDSSYFILEKIQIPTGIGILIPEDYYLDLRSKSGNFNNDYTSIMGLIDGDYTYSMGVQILPISDRIIELKPDEKFAQFILKKSYKIAEMNYIELSEWEKNPSVLERRKTRQGGFGHTGKFDK